MKKKILSSITVVILLAESVYAGESYLGFGYAMLDNVGKNDNGYLLDMGVRFGKKIKNRFGTEFTFTQTSDFDEGLGNYIDFYYSLGYEVYRGVTLNANIGYAFEDIGTVQIGSSKEESIYATGMSYGVGAYYDFTHHISIGLEYKKYDLSYDVSSVSLDHDIESVGLKVFYNF